MMHGKVSRGWVLAALVATGWPAGQAGAIPFLPFEQPPADTADTPRPPATPPQPTALEVEDIARAAEAAPRWKVRVEPSAWYTAPSGTIKLPRASPMSGGNTPTDVPDLNLDNPHLTPTGEVHLRRGLWRMAMRGFIYSADQESTGAAGQIGDVAYAPTDTLGTSFDFASFELEGGYTLAHGDLRPRQKGYIVRTNFEAVFGARAYSVDWRVDRINPGTGFSGAGADELFLEPLVGVKADLVLYDQLTMDVQLSVGGMPLGETSSASVDIIVGFAWQATENLGVQIGYRALFFDLQTGQEDAGFEFTGAMQGLTGGLVFTF